MNAVAALTRLFGDLAKYTTVRGAPLPDGSPIQRGGTPAEQDPRDAEKVLLAGQYSSALYRLGQKPGGDVMAAALAEFFSRAGVVHQGQRLLDTAEALEKRGVKLTSARPRKAGKRPAEGHLRRYESLIHRALSSYGAELRAS